MINDVECLILCLLVSSMDFFDDVFSHLLHTLIPSFVVIVVVVTVLYTLWRNICIVNIFFLSVSCVAIFLTESLEEQKF